MGIAKRLEARTKDGKKTRITREQAEDRLRMLMGLNPEKHFVRDREQGLQVAREKFDLQRMGLVSRTPETPLIREYRKMAQEIRNEVRNG